MQLGNSTCRPSDRRCVAIFAAVFVAVSALRADAQCVGRWERFPSAQVLDLQTLLADDAGGVLYGGGTFTMAAGTPCANIAQYDGNVWSPVGTGMNGTVSKLLYFDEDGSGPMPRMLLAGGEFTTAGGSSANRIARWDGTTWTTLGSGFDGPVLALCTFDDDGPGPRPEALYAAGSFSTADGASAGSIARWDGTSWSPLGPGANGAIRALAVFDPDGSGPGLPELFAAGAFTLAGGVVANGIASWNGSIWSALGSTTFEGVGATGVAAMAVFDEDGSGPGQPGLFVGGHFTHVSGMSARNVARWSGSAWSPLGEGLYYDDGGDPPAVRTMLLFDDDGPGPHAESLLVGGTIAFSVGMVYRSFLASWDGQTWSPLGSGPGSPSPGGPTESFLNCLAAWDEDGPGPDGPRLWAAGYFRIDVHEVNYLPVARWDTATWTWPNGAPNKEILGFEVFDDDGTGPGLPALYASGAFAVAGGIRTHCVAKFDGTRWFPLAEGIGQNGSPEPIVRALCGYDADDAGPAAAKLFAAGYFQVPGGVPTYSVAQWDGTAWSVPGIGGWFDSHSLATFDADGPGPQRSQLYKGGSVAWTSENIASWDGAAWHAVGTGVGSPIKAMTVHDGDGAGPGLPLLVVGGFFTAAGGMPANRIATWDGATWSPLGAGLDGPVHALASFDEDGPGPLPPALFAGGSFANAGGNPAIGIARWNGTAWSAVGAGGVANVRALAVFDDDGAGPHREALHAGGDFTTAGGVPALRLAKWDGQAWSALGGGITTTSPYDSVSALMPFDPDGAGPLPAALYIGGHFQQADGVASTNMAAWLGCVPVSTPFCSGDGSATPCPCGNSGAPGNGCAHSLAPSGANMASNGVASASMDSLVLLGTNMPESSCIYIQGNGQANGGFGFQFGDGLRCVSGTIIRLGLKFNVAGGSRYPESADLPISVRGQCSAGDVRNYQVWYRNAASFCTPLTFNFTNGLNLTWSP